MADTRELLAQYAREHDAGAFAALAREHAGMVYATCYRIVGNAAEAEDLSQECFLALARQAAEVRGAVGSWLHGVATHKALNALRARIRRRRHEGRATETRCETPSDPTWPEIAPAVDEAVEALPEELRDALIRHYLEGKTQADLAAEFGVSQPTVSRRLDKAVAGVRSQLAKSGIVTVGATLAAFLTTQTSHAAPAALTVGLTKIGIAGMGKATAGAAATGGAVKLATGLALAGAIAAGGIVAFGPKADPPKLTPKPPPQKRVVEKRAPAPVPKPVPGTRSQIEGVVVDEKGKPVSGAIVRVVSYRGILAQTRTSADGVFGVSTSKPCIRNLILIASTRAGLLQGLHEFDSDRLGFTRKPARIVVKKSLPVSVTVLDTKGRPVPDASVLIFHTYEVLAHGATDAGGRAAFRVPVDARVRWIAALKGGVGFDYFENYQTPQDSDHGPPPKRVALAFDGARTVRVKAVDSAGKPVPDVGFVPWTLQKPGKVSDINLTGCALPIATTNAKGIATFDWLPTNMSEPTGVMRRSEDYHLPEPPLLYPSPRSVTLNARLLRNVTLGGRVVLPDGKPAEGVIIQAEGRGKTTHYCRKNARTAADGSWKAKVYPDQTYVVSVIEKDWASRSYTGLIVREGTPRLDLDFNLNKGARIHGRVTAGARRTPYVGTVTLTQFGAELGDDFTGRLQASKRATLLRWTKTRADGRYAFVLGPGEYEMWASDPKRKKSFMVEGQKALKYNFHLDQQPKIRFRLSVVHKGRLIAGARVQASGEGGRFEGLTDAQGQLKLKRRAVRMMLHAMSSDGRVAAHATLNADQTTARVVLKPAASIRGRVLDAWGRPIPNLRFFCQPSSRGFRLGMAHFALTDPLGRFEIKGLVPGLRYGLNPQIKRGQTFKDRLYSPRIMQAQVVDLGDLTVIPSPKLTGTVFHKSRPNEPVAGAEIRVGETREANGTIHGGVGMSRADEKGKFCVYGNQGHVLIHARNRKGTAACFVEILKDEKHEGVALYLAPAATATGRLINADGGVVAGRHLGCFVRPMGRSGRPLIGWALFNIKSGKDGRFTIAGLPPGVNYEIVVASAQGVGGDDPLPFRIEKPGQFGLGDVVVTPKGAWMQNVR